MENIADKFINIFDKISKPSFLNKEALGGEIPFFIAPYNAKQELEVQEAIRLLKNKMQNSGIPILELNLYDISCDILEKKGGIERIFRAEKKRSKEKFLRALQSSLNIHEVLIPEIKHRIDTTDAKIYFLTGIGAVFPFIRSHSILNNLQNVAKEAPTLMFFPGNYNGHSLELFGLFKDDNYYRAFNIDGIKV